MSIELTAATDADDQIVRNLSAYYIYDFTEYTGWSCPENGLFAGCDELFDDWRAGKNHPFIIRVDGELAGFAGVAYDDSGEYFIQEFFVLRKFRRRGVGKSVAFMLFDRFPGKWKVQQLTANTPAVGFWRVTIDEYTSGVFTDDGVADSPWGTMSTLRFSNSLPQV